MDWATQQEENEQKVKIVSSFHSVVIVTEPLHANEHDKVAQKVLVVRTRKIDGINDLTNVDLMYDVFHSFRQAAFLNSDAEKQASDGANSRVNVIAISSKDQGVLSNAFFISQGFLEHETNKPYETEKLVKKG